MLIDKLKYCIEEGVVMMLSPKIVVVSNDKQFDNVLFQTLLEPEYQMII